MEGMTYIKLGLGCFQVAHVLSFSKQEFVNHWINRLKFRCSELVPDADEPKAKKQYLETVYQMAVATIPKEKKVKVQLSELTPDEPELPLTTGKESGSKQRRKRSKKE
jgi:hypothetical protein